MSGDHEIDTYWEVRGADPPRPDVGGALADAQRRVEAVTQSLAEEAAAAARARALAEAVRSQPVLPRDGVVTSSVALAALVPVPLRRSRVRAAQGQIPFLHRGRATYLQYIAPASPTTETDAGATAWLDLDDSGFVFGSRAALGLQDARVLGELGLHPVAAASAYCGLTALPEWVRSSSAIVAVARESDASRLHFALGYMQERRAPTRWYFRVAASPDAGVFLLPGSVWVSRGLLRYYVVRPPA